MFGQKMKSSSKERFFMNILLVGMLAYHNFGNACTNYALNEYVKQKGYPISFCNYMSLRDHSEENRGKALVKTASWAIISLITFSKQAKFRRFTKEHIRLTRKYRSFKELEADPPAADLYLVGSDQVWNPTLDTREYRLEWVKQGLKMAYSASIGESEMSEKDLNILASSVRDFRHIGIREESGKKLLDRAGIPNVKHVMDPVFLLSPEHWRNMVVPNRWGDYVLVLSYEKNRPASEVLKRFKKEKGLKIVEVGNSTPKFRGISDQHIKNIGVEETLSMIYHAKYVVTTSFHTTAFCLMFHKEFLSVLSIMAPSRQLGILKMCGLENRAVAEGENFTLQQKLAEIDWAKVDEILSERAEDSKAWLTDALKDCDEFIKKQG